MSARTPVYCVQARQLVAPLHSPLALGMLVAYAKVHNGGALNDTYEFVPALLTSINGARQAVAVHGPGVLLCSHYMWSTKLTMAIAKDLKASHPDMVTVHGGPSVPKYDYACETFFAEHPYVDVGVRGEGEVTAVEILERLAGRGRSDARDLDCLADVAGLTYRRGLGADAPIVRTPERARAAELDTFVSPYLTGVFRSEDAWEWAAALVETNRGCPYGCTFCDWGSATLQKVRTFSMDRVAADVDWIGRHRIQILWIADANFGILKRDVDIARHIAAVKQKYGYPERVVVNYAKNATERLAEILTIFHAAGIAGDGVISIQTQDPTTLKIVDRSNISTTRYEELIDVFRQRNIPVSSDLMMGLPGQTVASFKADLQFFFDRFVRAKAYATRVLPNSPMAHRDYMQAYNIVVDSSGCIVSTSTLTAEQRRELDRIYMSYVVFEGYALLKYYLYHLQADHRLQAIEVVDALQRTAANAPGEIPMTAQLIELMLLPRQKGQALDSRGRGAAARIERRLLTWSGDEWHAFHDEVIGFVRRTYGVEPDSATEAIKAVQVRLMPTSGRSFPERVSLPHDVGSYFRTLRRSGLLVGKAQGAWRPLVEYPPGVVEITDEDNICSQKQDVTKSVYDALGHHITWELRSSVRPPGGIDHFMALPAHRRSA